MDRSRSFVFQRMNVPIGYPFTTLSSNLALFALLHTKSRWNCGILIVPFSISANSEVNVTDCGSGRFIGCESVIEVLLPIHSDLSSSIQGGRWPPAPSSRGDVRPAPCYRAPDSPRSEPY